jgi:hypothetical protein
LQLPYTFGSSPHRREHEPEAAFCETPSRPPLAPDKQLSGALSCISVHQRPAAAEQARLMQLVHAQPLEAMELLHEQLVSAPRRCLPASRSHAFSACMHNAQRTSLARAQQCAATANCCRRACRAHPTTSLLPMCAPQASGCPDLVGAALVTLHDVVQLMHQQRPAGADTFLAAIACCWPPLAERVRACSVADSTARQRMVKGLCLLLRPCVPVPPGFPAAVLEHELRSVRPYKGPVLMRAPPCTAALPPWRPLAQRVDSCSAEVLPAPVHKRRRKRAAQPRVPSRDAGFELLVELPAPSCTPASAATGASVPSCLACAHTGTCARSAC